MLHCHLAFNAERCQFAMGDLIRGGEEHRAQRRLALLGGPTLYINEMRNEEKM
jgi:hypothetical protein